MGEIPPRNFTHLKKFFVCLILLNHRYAAGLNRKTALLQMDAVGQDQSRNNDMERLIV
jgi:hypothetical protein